MDELIERVANYLYVMNVSSNKQKAQAAAARIVGDLVPTQVYVAESGTYYKVIGVGRTETEAIQAVVDHLIKTNNNGYGIECEPTAEAMTEYYGINVEGPITIPGAVTEGQ